MPVHQAFHVPDVGAGSRRPGNGGGGIAAELVGVAALQIAIFRVVGADWSNYFWVSPAALVVASAVVMAYVFTNHFLHPITHEHDPVAGTTSIIVPPLCNRLHGNFSYHTEHHLFPSLNSDYYPCVSDALRAQSSGQYQQLPFADAWRQLWRAPTFRKMGTTAAQPDEGRAHKRGKDLVPGLQD